jgi:hypothetical protein
VSEKRIGRLGGYGYAYIQQYLSLAWGWGETERNLIASSLIQWSPQRKSILPIPDQWDGRDNERKEL